MPRTRVLRTVVRSATDHLRQAAVDLAEAVALLDPQHSAYAELTLELDMTRELIAHLTTTRALHRLT